MPYPGFDDPRLAAHPPGGNIYYPQDVAAAAGISAAGVGGGSGQRYADQLVYPQSRSAERHIAFPGTPPLMFATSATHTPMGEPIVSASDSSRGHWSEILNFSGSPAPWILIGILLVAGILHIEAKGGARVGK